MRVLHVTRDFPPPNRGGISTAVGGLVNAAVEHGIAAAVVSLERGRREACLDETESGVPIARIGDPTTPCDTLLPARFDVVHVHEPLGWPVAERAAAAGAAVVATIHVDHLHMAPLRGLSGSTASITAQQRVIELADAVIAPSSAAAAALVAHAPECRPRLRVVAHGIEPESTAAAAPGRAPLVTHAGRFDVVKGTADFAAAIVPLLAQRPWARACIAGGLPANAKAERRWRRRWAEQWPADVATRIDVLGWLERDALRALYRRSAVVVVPSRFETFGFVAAEAMACGAAVVAARTGGLVELIDDGTTGLLFAPGDRAALATAVGRCLDEPGTAAELGRTAARAVQARYGWGAAVHATAQVYSEALQRRGRR